MTKHQTVFTPYALLVAALCGVVVLALHGGSAYAVPTVPTTAGSGNALRISPVRTDLVIEPGNSKTVDLMVQNLSAKPAKLHPVVNDFTVRSGNETGQPDIILDENRTAATHSLKQYVGPLSDFTLAASEMKTVRVSVTIPAGAAGGGYFGAVRFEPVAADNAGQVSLTGSVGSLVLVKVPGIITENTTLASFDVRRGGASNEASTFFNDKRDLQAVVRFKNSGNVQVQPFGKVLLKNQSGKVLGTYEINDTNPRGNVLPGSIRRFEVPLRGVGSFGRFTVEANFGYGSSGQLLTAKKTFYVVPMWVVAVIAAVLMLALAATYSIPRAIRSYNRRIIARATRRR